MVNGWYEHIVWLSTTGRVNSVVTYDRSVVLYHRCSLPHSTDLEYRLYGHCLNMRCTSSKAIVNGLSQWFTGKQISVYRCKVQHPSLPPASAPLRILLSFRTVQSVQWRGGDAILFVLVGGGVEKQPPAAAATPRPAERGQHSTAPVSPFKVHRMMWTCVIKYVGVGAWARRVRGFPGFEWQRLTLAWLHHHLLWQRGASTDTAV